MKTLVYSIHGFDKPFLEKAAQGKHELVFTEKPLNETTANLAEGFDAVALFTADDASAEVLQKLYNYGIKHITLRSVGYDHIDLEKANRLKIKVANVPSYSPYAIAEHSVALLMALNRKIIKSQQLMLRNDFRLDKLVGFDLHGKTVGIIGTGKIGTAFAKIMHGFGCKLVAYDIIQNKTLIKETNIVYTSLENICKGADVISVNCPLNDATKYMFDKRIFDLMKKGVIFINTARGGIVNTSDLLDALDNGNVACAGLDVYENEKPIFFHNLMGKQIKDELFYKLRSHPKVLITGHQAFLTNEALQGIANTTIDNLTAWQDNRVSENEINKKHSNMKATPKIQVLFYQNLGKVFYAIAAADKMVHQDEVEMVKKIVNTDWLTFDGEKTNKELEAMRQIKITFYDLVNKSANAKTCLDEFEVYKKSKEYLFDDEVKKLIWKTTNEISAAFSSKNKSELIVLTSLGLILKEK